jgi:hypothetical protein
MVIFSGPDPQISSVLDAKSKYFILAWEIYHASRLVVLEGAAQEPPECHRWSTLSNTCGRFGQ